MSEDIPVAIGSATLRVFGVEVRVHNLSDGSRIIEEGSVVALLEAMASSEPGDRLLLQEEVTALAQWVKGSDGWDGVRVDPLRPR